MWSKCGRANILFCVCFLKRESYLVSCLGLGLLSNTNKQTDIRSPRSCSLEIQKTYEQKVFSHCSFSSPGQVIACIIRSWFQIVCPEVITSLDVAVLIVYVLRCCQRWHCVASTTIKSLPQLQSSGRYFNARPYQLLTSISRRLLLGVLNSRFYVFLWLSETAQVHWLCVCRGEWGGRS